MTNTPIVQFIPREKKRIEHGKEIKQQLKQELLENIDEIREMVENDEVVGCIMLCADNDGNYWDLVSAAMFEYPTETIGYLNLIQTRLTLEMLQYAAEAEEEDGDEV